MKVHAFDIREINQFASGASYVVAYSAAIEFVDAPGAFAVEMISVDSPDADPAAVEIGRQMIQRGAARALEGSGKVARIRVRDFLIHPIDVRPRRVEEYTYRAIRGVLDREA